MMNSCTDYIEIHSLDDLNKIDQLPKFVVGDQIPHLMVLSICADKGVNHVVQKSNLKSDVEMSLAATMLKSPRTYIEYPLSVIFAAPKPSQKTEVDHADLFIELSEVEEKSTALEDLTEYVLQHANPKSIIHDVKLVADELVTNAIYNAPYVDAANRTSGPDRVAGSVQIDPQKKPQLFAGSDDQRLVVGVKDFYGRLNTNSLIERIRRCYETNPRDQMNFGGGGAGIGSFMIFDSAASMTIAVDPGKSTTICCTFPLGLPARKRNSIPKNIHILTL